jgi:hypothetical protein
MVGVSPPATDVASPMDDPPPPPHPGHAANVAAEARAAAAAYAIRQRNRERARAGLVYSEYKQEQNEVDRAIPDAHPWDMEIRFLEQDLLFYVDDKKPRSWLGFFMGHAATVSERLVPPTEPIAGPLSLNLTHYSSVHDMTHPLPPYHRWFGRASWPIDSSWLEGDTRDYLTNVRGFDRFQVVMIYPAVRDHVMSLRSQLSVTVSTHQVLYAFVVDGVFADHKVIGSPPVKLGYDQSILENTIAVCVELMLHQQYLRVQRRGKVMAT